MSSYILNFFVILLVCNSYIKVISSNSISCELNKNEVGTCQISEECDFFTSGIFFKEKFDEFKLRARKCQDVSTKHICCETKENSDKETTTTSTTQKPTTTSTTSVPRTTQSHVTSPPVTLTTKPGANVVPSRVSEDSLGDKSKYFNLESCGLQTKVKIANGNLTTIKEYPWMAMLEYKVEEGNTFLCGGSLINEKYVLTAAHCIVDNFSRKLFSVRLGEHNVTSEKDCELDEDEDLNCADPVQNIKIEKWIIHPQFNGKTSGGADIALLRLSEPAKVTQNNIRPICLPFTGKNIQSSSDRYIVTGFGATENSSNSDVLLQATIPHYPVDQCVEIYNKEFRRRLPQNIICAGGESRIDSCQGDSGSPLQYLGKVAENLPPRMIQFGIVSFGPKGCGVAFEKPAVYTDVSKYTDWIVENFEP